MWVFRYVLKYLVELGLMLGRKYLLGQASRLKISLFFPSNTTGNSSHTIHLEVLAVNLSGDVTQGREYILFLLEKHINLSPQHKLCRLLRGCTWAKLQTYSIIE